MIKSFVCALLAVFAMQAMAADQVAPDTMIKQVMTDVLNVVKSDKAIQNGDQKRAIELVESKVADHFDFAHMTALAMGRDWRSATPQQRRDLSVEFKTLLERTYSNALAQYKDQTVDFKPLRLQPSDTDVVVRTEIRQPGAKAISVDYQMEKTKNGWKVYDVMVAGVSLVTNYRDTFSQEVKAGGIDGLLKSLREKNADLASAKK